MGRGRPHKCPYCEATKSVAKGFRYNKGGKVRLRRCTACGRRWTTGLVADDQPSVKPIAEETVPVVADQGINESEDTPRQAEESESATENGGDTYQEPDRRMELSLGGEGGPSQDDSGGQGKEESEEALFVQ